MKLYNYLRVSGSLTQAYQPIRVPVDPKDRQVKKMLETAQTLIDNAWARRKDRLLRQAEVTENGEPFDLEAARTAFYPVQDGEDLLIPLQYLQDYLVRRIAAVQINASIHDKDQVSELQEVFQEYGVEQVNALEGLTFKRIAWSALNGQKPKLMVHATQSDGEDVCIRFEAAVELCQKFMYAMQALQIKEGTVFSLKVWAEDPAIARNKKAGKKVADEGRFVNHNVSVTVDGKTHYGRPPEGVKFVQKPTLESMESLFAETQKMTLSA